jgi:hypothetical protein
VFIRTCLKKDQKTAIRRETLKLSIARFGAFCLFTTFACHGVVIWHAK